MPPRVDHALYREAMGVSSPARVRYGFLAMVVVLLLDPLRWSRSGGCR